MEEKFEEPDKEDTVEGKQIQTIANDSTAKVEPEYSYSQNPSSEKKSSANLSQQNDQDQDMHLVIYLGQDEVKIPITDIGCNKFMIKTKKDHMSAYEGIQLFLTKSISMSEENYTGVLQIKKGLGYSVFDENYQGASLDSISLEPTDFDTNDKNDSFDPSEFVKQEKPNPEIESKHESEIEAVVIRQIFECPDDNFH